MLHQSASAGVNLISERDGETQGVALSIRSRLNITIAKIVSEIGTNDMARSEAGPATAPKSKFRARTPRETGGAAPRFERGFRSRVAARAQSKRGFHLCQRSPPTVHPTSRQRRRIR